MKIIKVFVLLAFISFSFMGSAQETRVSVHLNNVTIEQVLNEIESQSDFYFLFNQKLIDVSRKVNVSADNKPIKELLTELFAQQGIEFFVMDQQIILTTTETFKNTATEKGIKLTGLVQDYQTGEPISGVSILINGTTQGGITDIGGKFEIILHTPMASVTFSSIGYNSKRITVTNNTPVAVFLEPEIKKLEEVIVIGYGTVTKSDLTGSVFSVKSQTMNHTGVANVNGLIQNTASGIVLFKNDAQPGAAFNVRIRGASSELADNAPLYVIDGLPLDFGDATPDKLKFLGSPSKDPLNSLNPNDILSVEVLKDASATAIYGSRGANGVIMITTRKGKTGKLKTTYNFTSSLQSPFREFAMMDAYQYADLYNKYVTYTNQALTKFTDDELESFKKMGKGTDWQKEVQRPVGVITDHMLSFSGGTDDASYYISLGYTDHKGLIKVSEMQRYTGKVNLDIRTTQRLNLGINVNISLINDNQIHQEAGDFGAQYNGVFTARQWAPIWPVRNSDGSFFLNPIRPDIPNPVSLLDITDEIRTFRTFGTIYAEYRLAKPLKLKFETGGDFLNARRGNYIPTTVVIGALKDGIAFSSNNYKNNYLTNLLVNYNPTLSRYQKLDAMFGFSYQNFINTGFSINQSGFPSDAFGFYNLNAGLQNDGRASYQFKHKLISTFARINYSLYDKYLFTLTTRFDGSSRFGKNNKWGFFPSGAFAWKLHNEEFLKNSAFISQLKVRGSIGISGNQEFANYQSLLLLSAESEGIYIGSTRVIGIKPIRGSNPDLKWESTRQIDFGVDFGFLKNKFTGSLGYYHKLTYNLLQNFKLSRSTGFEYLTANNGSVVNAGFEGDLNFIQKWGEINWETSFNLSYNKNHWKDRGNAEYGTEDEHGPLGGTYGWVVTGIENGQYVFKDFRSRDANNKLVNTPDGVADGNDIALLGYWLPKVSIGWNNKFAYKNFDISVFVQSMAGHKQTGGITSLFSLNNIIQEQRMNLPVQFYSLIRNDGTFDSGNALHLNDGTNNTSGGTPNTFTVEDASFIRIRNITAGYTFPQKWIKWAQQCRVFADAQNVLLLTRYTGYNPENGSALYPDVRTFSMGLNVSF